MDERQRMRRWREIVARAMEEKRRDSVARAAARSPGENIAEAFRLSAWASTFASSMERGEEIAPAEIWRRMHRRR